MENLKTEKKEKLELIKDKINHNKREDITRFTQMNVIINEKNELVIEKQPVQLQLELEQ